MPSTGATCAPTVGHRGAAAANAASPHDEQCVELARRTRVCSGRHIGASAKTGSNHLAPYITDLAGRLVEDRALRALTHTHSSPATTTAIGPHGPPGRPPQRSCQLALLHAEADVSRSTEIQCQSCRLAGMLSASRTSVTSIPPLMESLPSHGHGHGPLDLNRILLAPFVTSGLPQGVHPWLPLTSCASACLHEWPRDRPAVQDA